MRTTISITAATLLVAMLFPQAASAQVSGSAFGGINTSSGLFGQRSLGQSVSGRGNNFGSPGNAVQTVQAGAGEVTGGERFVRDSRQPGQFVGADSGDASNFFSQLQGGGFGNNLQNLAGRQQDFQNNNQRGGGSRAPLPPRLTLGFDYSGPGEVRVSTQLTRIVSKLPNLEIMEPVTVSMIGDTAVLEGRVATAHDREVIAQVALLEPGVGSVQNDLQVGTAPPEVTPVPPPIPESFAPPAPTAPRFDD